MTNVLDIPSHLLRQLLQSFLSVQSIRTLDFALLGSIQHAAILETVSDNRFVLTREIHGVVQKKMELRWMLQRGIAAEAVLIASPVTQFAAMSRVLRFAKHLWIHLPLPQTAAFKQIEISASLQELNVSVPDIGTLLPMLAMRCHQLKMVTIGYTGATENGGATALALARHCPQLTHFRALGLLMERDELGQFVALCPALKVLHVTTAEAPIDALRTLATACPQLQELEWEQQFMEVGHMAALAMCANLTTLVLTPSSNLPRAHVQALAAGCPSLTALSCKMNGDCIPLVAQAAFAPKLHLFAAHTPIAEENLCQLAERCTSLKVLRLPRCGVTDTGALAISRHCSKLEEINLSDALLHTATLCELLRACPALRRVNLHNVDVRDKVLTYMAKHCPQLEVLGLDSCEDITAKALEQVLRGCHKLKKLRVVDADRLTKGQVDGLRVRHAGVQIYSDWHFGEDSSDEEEE